MKRLVSLLAVACLAGCAGDASHAADGAVADASRLDALPGADAVADLVSVGDGARSDGAADSQAADGLACVPESDQQFCLRLGKQCDATTAKDNCGQSRTTNCGSCVMPQTCGGGGVANICGFSNAKWGYEVIDASADVGQNVAMAIDYAGVPYVVYTSDAAGKPLYFAARTGAAAWTTTVLDSGALAGEFADIAIDPQGVIHIAARSAGVPTYYTLTGKGWAKETFAALGGRYLALTFDSAGNAHICHTDSRDELLMHSYQDGGWKTETIAGKALSGQKLGAYCAIAVDSKGTVHVSYENSNWLSLGYGYKLKGGGWMLETAAQSKLGKVGGYGSLVLDANQAPRVAFHNLAERRVDLASRATSGWLSQQGVAAGSIAVHSSLAIDKSQFLHLSFFHADPPGLIHYSVEQSGSWTTEAVALVGTGGGGHNDLQLDSQGGVHLAFYNRAAKRLEYAKRK